MNILTGLLAVGLAAAPAIAQTAGAGEGPGPLAPRDECTGLPGYAEFHQRLERAITLRDADALIALTDPDVTLDFGGGSGVEVLRKRLDAGSYNSWAELAGAVQLGCGIGEEGTQDPDYIAFPWYFTKTFGGEVFETVIVTGVDVPLRFAPADDARVIERISWDWALVRYDDQYVDGAKATDQQTGYQAVTTQDGAAGYIADHALRSIVDYRIAVNRIDGKWTITAFVAGD
ncbi:hypothetical protein ABC955_08720 [Citromicrobium bathyomarinum]